MKRVMWVLKCVVFAVLMLGLVGLATQLLWNWLVPVLFNGPVITFAQGLGLLVLSKIFFWSFGKHQHGGHRGGPWRGYWKEKLNKMTPEEREAFKRKMNDRWCRTSPSSSPEESSTANG
jgi:hypothetical protein